MAREAAQAGRADRMVELAGGDPEAVRGEHVTAAAAEGDADALAVLDRFAWWVAVGLANLANILDPELIVLGGGIIETGAVVLEPTRTAFLTLLEGARHRPPIELVAAALGERAGAVGAAILAAS
jgi:glucokinase